MGINLNQLLWVRFGQKEQKLWEKLEQALKVTDLLLHNRGFGAVVLDLRGLPSISLSEFLQPRGSVFPK